MRWRGERQSSNVEDRRGQRVGGGLKIGGLGMVAVVLIGMFLGVDPRVLMTGLQGAQVGGQSTEPAQPYQESAAEAEQRQMIAVVLADTEEVWREQFRQLGGTYQEPKLVLFTEAVQSACGAAQSAMGPFYCPADQNVFIDLSFFNELDQRMGAGGDFAQAYVVAHEVGHHVQNLLGISEKVHGLRQRVGEIEANQLSVRQELQADCFAGMWARLAQQRRQLLEPGDIEEALAAATAVGDDRLQQQARGYVVPDSFTHGSSEQRMRWFQRGFESGQLADCDTFAAADL